MIISIDCLQGNFFVGIACFCFLLFAKVILPSMFIMNRDALVSDFLLNDAWYVYASVDCLTLSNIRYVSRIKWSNRRKGVVPFHTPQCSSYRKGSFLVTLDNGRQLYFLNIYIQPPENKSDQNSYELSWLLLFMKTIGKSCVCFKHPNSSLDISV